MSASLSSFLVDQERKDPGRTYLSGPFGQLSYGEVLTLARQLSRFLADTDRVATRSAVGIYTESPQYTVFIVWAAILADISIVFLPGCRNRDMLRRAMEETSVEVLLTDDAALLHESFCLDLREILKRISTEDGRQAVSAKALQGDQPGTDAGFIFQTSGTAGEPKWVQCEYRKFHAVINCMLQNGVLAHANGQSVFLTPPLYHSYGLSAFLEYTSVGSTIIFPLGTSPLGPVGDLRHPAIRESVTAIEGVPYFYRQFSRLAHRFMMPALNHLGLGGGGLDKTDFGMLLDLYPEATVSVRYGMTETPSVVSHKIFRPPFGGDWSSSGAVLPVYAVDITDVAGRNLGSNQEGEIVVSGSCVGTYLGQSGSRLLTGDTGYLNDSNELVVNGRTSLYIKNRGFRISPELVESVIASFRGVKDCRVRMRQYRLVAEIVYDGDIPSADILAYMSARLPVYAIADELVKVESIPRTPSGKIKRYDSTANEP